MNSTKIRALSILALCSTAACDQAVSERGVGNGKGVIDVTGELAGNGKADIGKKAKVIDDVGPEAKIVGTFDPRMRVYGYVIDARAGAKLNMAVTATAGDDARDLEEGEALDTVLTLYGPYKGPADPGEQIAYHDDEGSDLSAPPIDFEVPADGRYLVALSSWDDTGSGSYTVDVECQGTDFQCARPDFENPCIPGQHFVQGAEIKADATWDRCEVILLETATVAEDAVLTVDPGVSVKGNFLGNGNFGDVQLVVNGTIQVAGTKADPVRFTSMKADRGWGGIVINGPSSSFQYTYFERAQAAMTLNQGASVAVEHAVFEGGLPGVITGRNGTGITALADTLSTFNDVLVHNFATGISANLAEDMVIEDSVIKNNNIGVQMRGNGTTSTSCSNSTPPQVTVWRDPRVANSDVIDNNQGILAMGRDVLVEVEHSNLVGNSGFAFEHRGRRLHPESFLRHNNIHDNGATQVRTSHWRNGGTLDISSNYWVDISDPELSANWQESCNGGVRFDGFSPTPIDTAGPRHADNWFAVCSEALEPCEEGDDDTKEPKPWDGLDEEATIAKDAETRFETPELAPGTYLFSMSGTNDADLYVRTGSAPTESNFDCRPFQGSTTESCTVELVAPSIIHVMVRGWAPSSDFRLVGQEI